MSYQSPFEFEEPEEAAYDGPGPIPTARYSGGGGGPAGNGAMMHQQHPQQYVAMPQQRVYHQQPQGHYVQQQPIAYRNNHMMQQVRSAMHWIRESATAQSTEEIADVAQERALKVRGRYKGMNKALGKRRMREEIGATGDREADVVRAEKPSTFPGKLFRKHFRKYKNKCASERPAEQEEASDLREDEQNDELQNMTYKRRKNICGVGRIRGVNWNTRNMSRRSMSTCWRVEGARLGVVGVLTR